MHNQGGETAIRAAQLALPVKSFAYWNGHGLETRAEH